MAQKNTVRLTVNMEAMETFAAQQALAQAAQVLRTGGTVAFPTETVYGLGANALDAQAVEGIFLAKQRPAWDPLIVHVTDTAMLHRVVSCVSKSEQKLMDAFWPGPLTLLLPKQSAVPSVVTAGRALVGVRMPAHPVAHAMIAAAGVPLAAPSANRFGHTSPTTAQHVLDDLDGRIDLVLDAGPTRCGVESTVIEVGEEAIILYRPGAIAAEQIQAIAGRVVLYQSPAMPPGSSQETARLESLPSPGVGIRHYAPNAVVFPVDVGDAPEAAQQERWLQAVGEQHPRQERVGVMLPSGWPVPKNFFGVQFAWGSWQNDKELAQRLFKGLRALDALGAELILCPLPSSAGLGAAIQDRLLKAAREK